MRDTDRDEVHVLSRKPLFIPLDDTMSRPMNMTSCRCQDSCICSAGAVIGSMRPVRRDRLSTEQARLSKALDATPTPGVLTVRWFNIICETWTDSPKYWPRYRHFRPVRTEEMFDDDGVPLPLPILPLTKYPL